METASRQNPTRSTHYDLLGHSYMLCHMIVGKRWIAVATLVLVLVIGIACGDDDDGATTSGHPTASVLNEITLTMSDELSFDPNEIEVKVGEPVRLSVQNPDAALHDFTVEDSGRRRDIGRQRGFSGRRSRHGHVERV